MVRLDAIVIEFEFLDLSSKQKIVLENHDEVFGRILDQAIRQDRRSRLTGDRRNPVRTERAADGTLIFQAESGERWYVYDRRSGERRRTELSDAPSYRAFVNEEGIELRVSLEPQEFADKSAEALQRQLARAK